MADLLYHAIVLLRVKDVKMEEVFEIPMKRFRSQVLKKSPIAINLSLLR
jgi:phosphoribosyl-ATP pyrophosphohydrolase